MAHNHRILFVITTAEPGGARRSLELLIYAAAKAGKHVALVCPRKGIITPKIGEFKIQLFITCPFDPICRSSVAELFVLFFHWLACMVVMLKAIMVFRPGIIHANNTRALLVAILPAILSRRVLVWHVRDMVPLGWIGRIGSLSANAIIAISNAVKQDLINQGISPDKIHVIYNHIAPGWGQGFSRTLAKQIVQKRFGFPADSFIYLNVGQYVAWKKQDLFLKAAAQIILEHKEARFVIAGGRPCGGDRHWREYLAQLIPQLGLLDKAILLDWQEDIEVLLAGADVLVHPAVNEPFGRVLIEAMLLGTPIIATCSGGPKEIIEPGRSGQLVKVDDIHELANSMTKLWQEKDTAKALADNGRKRVETLFSMEIATRTLLGIYEQISGHKGNRSCVSCGG